MRPYQAYWDCKRQRVNTLSHCVTLTRLLLPHIISDSDTILPVLIVMECKGASVISVYELIFLLYTSRSTEYKHVGVRGGHIPTQ